MILMKNNNGYDENIRQRNKDSAQNAALFWIRLANDRLSEINKHLLGLATILLPLTASIVISPIKFREYEKTLMIIGWVFLFISIIAGFMQIVIDAIYFKDLSRDSSKREVLWSDTNSDIRNIDKDIKALGNTPASSTHIPLILQSLAISLGLFLIMLVAVLLLIKK